MKEETLIKEIQVLKLEAGDILVFKTDRKLSMVQYDKFREFIENTLTKFGKKGSPALLLEDGMDIQKLKLPEWKDKIIDIVVEDIRNRGKVYEMLRDIIPIKLRNSDSDFYGR